MTDRVSYKTVLTDPVHFLAFGFGAGLSAIAPGTVGTLVGVGVELAMRPLDLLPRIILVTVLFVTGIWICGESARRLGEHDHPGIVWDEIVGYLMVMFAAPAGWPWILAGFVLFRLFDIVKPWPIRDVDHRLGGGFGIMLDDALAAVYAVVCLLILRFLIPGAG